MVHQRQGGVLPHCSVEEQCLVRGRPGMLGLLLTHREGKVLEQPLRLRASTGLHYGGDKLHLGDRLQVHISDADVLLE